MYKRQVLKEATKLYELQTGTKLVYLKPRMEKTIRIQEPPPIVSFKPVRKERVSFITGVSPRQKTKDREVIAGLKFPSAQDFSFKQISGTGQVSAQEQKQAQKEKAAFAMDFKMDFGVPPARLTGRAPRPPKPPKIVALPPITFPSFFPTKKKKKRGKAPKSIFRKTRYTPSLAGALGLVKPIKAPPKMVTGLKIRPLIKKKKR